MNRLMMMPVLIVLVMGLVGVFAYAESDLPSPHQQLQMGIPIQEIQCKSDTILLQSPKEKPACVSDNTAKRLVLRGWIVVEPATPESVQSTESTTPTDLPVDIPTDTLLAEPVASADVFVDAHLTRDPPAESDSILYILNDGKVSLANVPRLKDPTAIWFPITFEKAPEVAQRLADALDDKIILPLIIKKHKDYVDYDSTLKKIIFSDSSRGRDKYYYETEKGNLIQLIQNYEKTGVDSIHYYVNEDLSYYTGEEFLESFMEKSGFGCSGQVLNFQRLIDISICGTGRELSIEYPQAHFSVPRIIFNGWSEYQTPDAYPHSWAPANWMNRTFGFPHLGEEELRYRVYEFAKENAYRFNCQFQQYHYNTQYYLSAERYELQGIEPVPLYKMRSGSYIHAGVPLVTFTVGECDFDYHKYGGSPNVQKRRVIVDSSGEVMWLSPPHYGPKLLDPVNGSHADLTKRFDDANKNTRDTILEHIDKVRESIRNQSQ